ncbi:MAG TPA: cupin domain-containing protein [Solirubrobacteraceae bacterium]|nr:cupin domain-containing protein [Solirubrobacteraceae bacterium]
MLALSLDDLDFADAWLEGDESARWRSASGHSPSNGAAASSGSSVLEVGPGCKLPEHTDSAEETIVVLNGTAEVQVGDETAQVAAGGLALVPKDVPHEVRNAADEVLRFAAVYAEPDVVTTYREPVQPDGSRERHTVS